MFNFFIRLVAVFIFNKEKRKAFRKKHIRVNGSTSDLEKLERSLKQHIDFRLNCILNSFFDVQDVKPASGELRVIQNGNAILLEKLKQICDEHNIPYWLDYGTLLGACRHNGFIPWDDDIDVGMMRSDFERLEKILQENTEFRLSEWLHLKHAQCRVKKFMFTDRSCNLFVDIFCYDYCVCEDVDSFYEDYIERKNLLRENLKKLNMPHYNFCACDDIDDLKIINKVFDKYKIKSYKDGNFIIYGIENPHNAAKRIYKKDIIFPLSTITFEGVEYSAPNNIDSYLHTNYGNYLRIPYDVGFSHHPAFSYNDIIKIKEICENYNDTHNNIRNF